MKISSKLNNRPAISEIVNLCFNCGEFAIIEIGFKSIEFEAFKNTADRNYHNRSVLFNLIAITQMTSLMKNTQLTKFK